MLEVETPADRFTEFRAGLVVDPRFYEIITESWWIDSVKYASGRDDIAIVRRRDGQGWTVGVWIVEPGDGHPHGIILELEGMKKHPDAIDSDVPTVEYMLIRLRPTDSTIKKYLKRQAEAKRDRQNIRDANVEFRNDMAKSLRRVLGNHDPIPDLVRSGFMHLSNPELR